MMDSPEDLEGASRAIMRAMLQMNRRLRAQRPASAMSSSQLTLLSTLYRLGAMPAARLAEHERLQPQSLTRVIAELEEAGMIFRRPDAADRRARIIELTGKGKLALGREFDSRRQWLARAMVAALSPTERALLQLSADLMVKIAACELEPAQADEASAA